MPAAAVSPEEEVAIVAQLFGDVDVVYGDKDEILGQGTAGAPDMPRVDDGEDPLGFLSPMEGAS